MADLPPGAVDAHVHLIGDDYALSPTAVEVPPAGTLEDWLGSYRKHLARMGCSRGVIVHSILYGIDNTITLDAVRAMGEGFAAVVLVPDDVSDATLDALAKAGARAVRLNYVHGGVLTWEGAKRMAPRLADRGLHIEMLAHSHLHLADLADDVRAMPCPVVFDHCAWPDPLLGIRTEGHQALLRLMGDGDAWTKLSAPYRWAGSDEEARQVITSLAAANPEHCLWGSDWPHLMLGGVAMPDTLTSRDILLECVTDSTMREQIFVSNPNRLYQLG